MTMLEVRDLEKTYSGRFGFAVTAQFAGTS